MLFSEPKIPQLDVEELALGLANVFQCSSASRKFLNLLVRDVGMGRGVGFSALQRAENSSIPSPRRREQRVAVFQCSSASRKFLNQIRDLCALVNLIVSVLFSEPKIPQLYNKTAESGIVPEFQCSSASRKFLNWYDGKQWCLRSPQFQCSSASRKFLNQHR